MTLHIRIWLLLAGFILLCFSGFAQKQDNVWCMGHNGGVNFNTSPPVGFHSGMYSLEPTASISDKHTGAFDVIEPDLTIQGLGRLAAQLAG